jgi:hypothetical protein
MANAQSGLTSDWFNNYPSPSSLHLADRTNAPTVRAGFDAPQSSRARWLTSSVDIDLPRASATGSYTRPKLMIGLPSAPMRSWLRAAGVDAERCQLPMLRARTSMASGDLNGTLWLYARCSFH